MTDIYDQHSKAFARVEAYVICKDGERVATIAFKFPADGAGRLYAYAHWIGLEMVRGFAAGGGYDKRSAACRDAFEQMRLDDGTPDFIRAQAAGYGPFRFAMLNGDNGAGWDRCLRDAGFTVLQAV